jgi:hypothetical protein
MYKSALEVPEEEMTVVTILQESWVVEEEQESDLGNGAWVGKLTRDEDGRCFARRVYRGVSIIRNRFSSSIWSGSDPFRDFFIRQNTE